MCGWSPLQALAEMSKTNLQTCYQMVSSLQDQLKDLQERFNYTNSQGLVHSTQIDLQQVHTHTHTHTHTHILTHIHTYISTYSIHIYSRTHSNQIDLTTVEVIIYCLPVHANAHFTKHVDLLYL